MDRGRSPRRAHILASINPHMPEYPRHDEPPSPLRSARPRAASVSGQASEDAPERAGGTEDAERSTQPSTSRSTTTKFRFKSDKHKSRRRDGDGDDPLDDRPRRRHRARTRSREREQDGSAADPDREEDDERRRRRHRRRHRSRDGVRHHRSKRRRKEDGEEAKEEKREAEAEDPYAEAPLDADAAFRASLFDAMADDEGAAYWEAVYGQPIHTYGPSAAAAADGNGDGGGGPLEAMTDEEYAAHVRQRMWEKTHEGLLEERERRKRLEKEKAEAREERRRLDAEVEKSLRRGEERRAAKAWRSRWRAYCEAWTRWENGGGRGEGDDDATATAPGTVLDDGGGVMWPVHSGDRRDIGEEAVRDFFVQGLDSCSDDHDAEETDADRTKKKGGGFAAGIKDERVRWHPDKMQRRFGGHVDEVIMRDVTAIFQIVDKLWNDTRPKRP